MPIRTARIASKEMGFNASLALYTVIAYPQMDSHFTRWQRIPIQQIGGTSYAKATMSIFRFVHVVASVAYCKATSHAISELTRPCPTRSSTTDSMGGDRRKSAAHAASPIHDTEAVVCQKRAWAISHAERRFDQPISSRNTVLGFSLYVLPSCVAPCLAIRWSKNLMIRPAPHSPFSLWRIFCPKMAHQP